MIEGACAISERVCVAVPTFRRPQLLERLLDGIAAQTIAPSVALEVLVIDNDVEPSAERRVAARRDAFPFQLTYAHVPEPGLSSVRNRALEYARTRCDVLAMIDDDEYPEPQWLAELLRVAAATNADVVIGPVPQRLPAEAPRWLRASRLYDLPVGVDEAPIAFGYSGNCLLRVATLERFAITFDPRLGLAGGEDYVFFQDLLARGTRFAYAARAVAHETVPPERLSASYVLRLYFRRGNTLAICDRRLRPRVATLTRRACTSLARIALGGATLLPLTLAHGRAGAMTACCSIANGAGALAGLAGHVHQGYARTT